MGGEGGTSSTIDIHYGIIHPHRSDIVKPMVLIKPSLHTRFGPTMMKYAFMSLPQKLGLKVKAIHKQTTRQRDIWN